MRNEHREVQSIALEEIDPVAHINETVLKERMAKVQAACPNLKVEWTLERINISRKDGVGDVVKLGRADLSLWLDGAEYIVNLMGATDASLGSKTRSVLP